MKPNKDKSPLGNFLGVLVESNPQASVIQENQVFITNVVDIPELPGRARLRLNAVQDAGFSGSIELSYLRHPVNAYVPQEEYISIVGNETEEEILDLISEAYGLVKEELEVNLNTAHEVGDEVLTGVVEVKVGSIIYRDSTIELWLATVPLEESRIGPDGFVRMTRDGVVRRFLPPATFFGQGAGSSTPLSTKEGYATGPVAYYGLIPSSEFINGTDLATHLDVTEGSIITDAVDCDWMKFTYQDKTLFIPMKTYRNAISWEHLYSKGIVYGDGTYGTYPGVPDVLQDRTIEIGDWVYRVRLPTGSNVEPNNSAAGYALTSSDISTSTAGSEWNELIYRVSDGNPYGTGDNFIAVPFTDIELGIYRNPANDRPGSYTWCKEASTRISNGRVVRGWDGPDFLSIYASGSTAVWTGWRPVLELVGRVPPATDGDLS